MILSNFPVSFLRPRPARGFVGVMAMPSRSVEEAEMEVMKFWEVVFWILEVRSWIWRVEKEEFCEVLV